MGPQYLQFPSTSLNSVNRSLSSPELPNLSPVSPAPSPFGDIAHKKADIMSSVESLEAGRKYRVGAPQVQINGSILSVRTNTLNRNNRRFMKFSRNLSLNSMHSDSKKNLLSFQNVGRALERTHSHLKRTRLTHVFYLLALPVYTLLGALIFQVSLFFYFNPSIGSRRRARQPNDISLWSEVQRRPYREIKPFGEPMQRLESRLLLGNEELFGESGELLPGMA